MPYWLQCISENLRKGNAVAILAPSLANLFFEMSSFLVQTPNSLNTVSVLLELLPSLERFSALINYWACTAEGFLFSSSHYWCLAAYVLHWSHCRIWWMHPWSFPACKASLAFCWFCLVGREFRPWLQWAVKHTHWAKCYCYYYGGSSMKFLLLCFLHFPPLNLFQKFSPAAILFSKLLHLLTEDSPIHCSLMGDQYSFWLFALIWNEKLCIAKNMFCFVYTPCAWLHNLG